MVTGKTTIEFYTLDNCTCGQAMKCQFKINYIVLHNLTYLTYVSEIQSTLITTYMRNKYQMLRLK